MIGWSDGGGHTRKGNSRLRKQVNRQTRRYVGSLNNYDEAFIIQSSHTRTYARASARAHAHTHTHTHAQGVSALT